MGEATFTVQVDEDLERAFANAAKSHDCTAADLVREFMREYVAGHDVKAEYDRWFRRQVEIGLDSARAGHLVPDDAVEAEAVSWRDATRRRAAART